MRDSVPNLDELDSMLRLAEDLNQSIERSQRLQQLAIGGGVLIALIAFTALQTLPITNAGVIALPALVMVAAVFGQLFVLRPMRYRQRVDARALHEVVQVLHETGYGIGRSREWTKLQELEFRIRLSRFELGLRMADARSNAESRRRRLDQDREH